MATTTANMHTKKKEKKRKVEEEEEEDAPAESASAPDVAGRKKKKKKLAESPEEEAVPVPAQGVKKNQKKTKPVEEKEDDTPAESASAPDVAGRKKKKKKLAESHEEEAVPVPAQGVKKNQKKAKPVKEEEEDAPAKPAAKKDHRRSNWDDAARKDNRGRNWEEAYNDLKSYYDEHGDCGAHSWSHVGQFVAQQRRKRTRNQLSAEQIRRLDEVNMNWDTVAQKNEKRWNEMLVRLKKYRKKYGDTRVPQNYPDEPQLGRWVTSQMTAFRLDELNPERMEKLEYIGFDWYRNESRRWKGTRNMGKYDDTWNEKFKELVAYKREHGHTLVTSRARAFERAHGMTPDDDGDNEETDLGLWVCAQRRKFRDEVLPPERKAKLEKIGFVFVIDHDDPKTSLLRRQWEIHFINLSEFKKTHGHCRVFDKSKTEDRQLALWVGRQRKKHKQGELDKSQVERLESLGLVWNPQEDQWTTMIFHLTKYRKAFGHLRMPARYTTEDGVKLGRQVRTCITNRRDGDLSPERIAELDSLDFVWDNVLDLHWEAMYERLEVYKNEFGDCRVPFKYDDQCDSSPTTLGSWVSFQRQSLRFRKDPKAVERQGRLHAIGFIWNANDPDRTCGEENFMASFSSR
jgi:hypothetical protein